MKFKKLAESILKELTNTSCIILNENSQSIYNKILKYDDLTEFLGYLVHDKEHVMNNKDIEPNLEKVFTDLTQKDATSLA